MKHLEKHSRQKELSFTPEDLRWATPEIAARYRAKRLSAHGKIIADLGCGIGFQTFAFAEKFSLDKKHDFIKVDTSLSLVELKQELAEKLKGKFSEFEAHLSLASGTGKEHMAVIAAILSIPMGIRLVAFTKKGVETLN